MGVGLDLEPALCITSTELREVRLNSLTLCFDDHEIETQFRVEQARAATGVGFFLSVVVLF